MWTALEGIGWAAGAVGGYLVLVWLPVPFDIALFVLVALGLIAVLATLEHPMISWPIPDLPLLAYLGLSVLGIALANDWVRALALSSALLPASFLYLLTSRYLRPGRDLLLVLGALGLAVAGLSLLILISTLGQPDSTAIIARAGSPILIVPNDLLFVAIAAPLLVAAGLTLQRRIWHWLFAICVALSLAALIAVQSRSGVLALLLGLLALAMRLQLRGLWQSLAGLGLVFLAVDAATGFALARKFTSLCFTRGPFWSAAWQLFLERPWLGHGAHSFVHLYQGRLPQDPSLFCEVIEPRLTPWPHNLFLELLSSQGMFGTALFVGVLLWSITTAYRAGNSRVSEVRRLAAGLFAAWVAFVFAAIFELSLLRLWVVVMFALLVAITVRLRLPSTLNQSSSAARGAAY